MFGSPGDDDAAATRSSSTRRSASTSAASARSRRPRARREGPGRRRQPHAREGREEQDGAARSARSSSTSSTARASRRSGDIVDLADRGEHHREERRLVLVPGRAHRPGPRERAAPTSSSTPQLMDKIEAMVLAKHGIKRTGQAAPAAQPNGAPADDKAQKPAGGKARQLRGGLRRRRAASPRASRKADDASLGRCALHLHGAWRTSLYARRVSWRMKLYVMRHGPAEDHADSGRDADRALTAAGRERVVAVAAEARRGGARRRSHIADEPARPRRADRRDRGRGHGARRAGRHRRGPARGRARRRWAPGWRTTSLTRGASASCSSATSRTCRRSSPALVGAFGRPFEKAMVVGVQRPVRREALEAPLRARAQDPGARSGPVSGRVIRAASS